jgi:hypothetical protein
MNDNFRKFMINTVFEKKHEEFDFDYNIYDHFFTEVGQLFDSLDSENISDDIHDLIDDLIDKIFDVIISLGDEEFDKDTEDQFLDIVHMMGLDDEIDEDIDEDINTLKVKNRKVKAGQKRSEKSKLKGSDRLKYLKKLKDKRKEYKKNVSLRKKVKKKSKKYRKTSKAKVTKKRYDTIHKNR